MESVASSRSSSSSPIQEEGYQTAHCYRNPNHCYAIKQSPKIDSPQIEGDGPKSAQSPNYSEGDANMTRSDPPLSPAPSNQFNDDNQDNQDDEDDDLLSHRRELLGLNDDRSDIKDNPNYISSSSSSSSQPISPISPPKRRGKKRRRNHGHNHYEKNGQIAKKMKPEIIDITGISDDDSGSFASDSSYSSPSRSYVSNKSNPIIINDNDSDDDDVQIIESFNNNQSQRNIPICTVPDFPSPPPTPSTSPTPHPGFRRNGISPSVSSSPTPFPRHPSISTSPTIPPMNGRRNAISPTPSYNFNDTSSMNSASSSTLCNGIGRMRMDIIDDSPVQNHRYKTRQNPPRQNPPRPNPPRQNPPRSKQEEIMRAWKEQINPKETTLKGLESIINKLSMPRKEFVAFYNAICHYNKHLISSVISYDDRNILMTVALLEKISLYAKTGNPVDRWMDKSRKPQILFVAPTKHQAIEAENMFKQIGQFYQLYSAVLIGGMPSYQCVQQLSSGLDVVCGTPGKLCTMVKEGALSPESLSNLIAFAMDGADDLTGSWSMRQQMRIITSALPPNRYIQVLWIESVLNPKGRQHSERWIKNLDSNIENMADSGEMIDCFDMNNYNDLQQMKHIEKYVSASNYWSKYDGLMQILRYYGSDNMVVFFNTRLSLKKIFNQVVKNGDNGRKLVRSRSSCYCIDGSCSNDERDHIITNFKKDGGIMFTTDLMSGGISLNVNCIINYDVPAFNPSVTYIKRAGVAIPDKPIFIFSIIRKDRNWTKKNNDQENMECIRMDLRVQYISYHQFSEERRHHRSFRSQSILRDI